MVLVDTSIWIDHFRNGSPGLAAMLDHMDVLIHPFVVGELALGNLKDADPVFEAMSGLPALAASPDPAVLAFIARHGLQSSGIGYIDAHLLTAVGASQGARLWTRDKRLKAVADRLSVSFSGE